MKKRIATSLFVLGLLVTGIPGAKAVSMDVDNAPTTVSISVYNATSYVPLRSAVSSLCPSAKISWENHQAVVTTPNLTLTARPGDCYLDANGRMLYIKDGVRILNGSTMVPIRVLGKALDVSVAWDSATNKVLAHSGNTPILSGDKYYDSASVYWLCRIIHAESGIEPFDGKIAVGSVILNRVKSPDFPNSIYDVIFDTHWGIQFEPVGNGTIYDAPNEDSILAAKLCLDGATIVGNSLYFLEPAKAKNFWTVENCTYIATIGNHQFYE